LNHPNGKVHRVFHDGAIPPDNPFVHLPRAINSIWTVGHRNPQGLARDPATWQLWESEHGPRGGDEINLLRRGRNYGWPLVTHGIDYDGTPIARWTARKGMESPIIQWTPSIAVSAIMFYSGERFPRWRNNLFAGSLAQQKLLRIEVRAGTVLQQEVIADRLGRIRAMVTGPDGLIYLALEAPGRIVRLAPA
jgi:glucose/arabinose dehydrogenase